MTDAAEDPVVVKAESAAPGPAGPGTASQASGSEPRAADDTGAANQPRRRPRSLRTGSTSSGEEMFRGLSAPQFPHAPNLRPVEPAVSASGPSMSQSDPVMPAPDSGPSAVEQLTKLINERPEITIGIAFVGGVVLATILKRLAR